MEVECNPSWWGIDVSTRKLAIAMVGNDGTFQHETHLIGHLTGGERFAALYRASLNAVRIWQDRRPPVFVYVEQPSGRLPNPQLSYAVGAIMAGIWEESCRIWPAAPVTVETVPSGTWKKLALGDGHGCADKAEILEWAIAQGLHEGLHNDQDAADALGIAMAARINAPGASVAA